jgi:hypothetical protein
VGDSDGSYGKTGSRDEGGTKACGTCRREQQRRAGPRGDGVDFWIYCRADMECIMGEGMKGEGRWSRAGSNGCLVRRGQCPTFYARADSIIGRSASSAGSVTCGGGAQIQRGAARSETRKRRHIDIHDGATGAGAAYFIRARLLYPMECRIFLGVMARRSRAKVPQPGRRPWLPRGPRWTVPSGGRCRR